MARTVRDESLGSRSARAKLKVRGKPYFRSLDEGVHIGYRKNRDGGKWVGRFYLGERDYRVETIAVADDKADPDGIAVLSFAQAQKEVRRRHAEFAATSRPAARGPYTVRACLEEYQRYLEARTKSAYDTAYRIEALIVPALGSIPCDDLTKPQLEEWLNSLANSPPRVRSRRGGEQRYRRLGDTDEARRQRRSSANRVFTMLKAALNRAWRDGKITSDRAWRTLTPFEEADAARVRYLTIEECRRLINTGEGAFRVLVCAALATGARYGELIALEVRDFNPDAGTLHIRTSKSGKARHVILNSEGVDLFATLTAGRAGSEVMLHRDAGGPWRKANQTKPMVAACARAGIEPAANFHALRHTYASHSIMNGVPLLVVSKNLGHSDTRMAERHYSHLSTSFVADAIRLGAPRFGIEPSNVTRVR